jgi:sarcosine oxidase
MHNHDVIVVGLGTVGSATCLELSRRGLSVLGLDALRPPHNRGSHHGESRSIRRAYLEGTAYVPMALRAWELWRKLERDSASTLLATTENLTIGPPDAPAVKGFLTSAHAYEIPHEYLEAAEVRRRWPQLAPPDTFAAGLEKKAGVIFPESAIAAFLAQTKKMGAQLQFDEPVSNWSARGDRVEVRTHRAIYEAGRVLLAAGARNKTLLGPLGACLSPKRVPVHWAAPPVEEDFKLDIFPVNFWQLPVPGQTDAPAYREFYSLPVIRTGGRVKVAPHNNLADCDPATTPRNVSPKEVAHIRTFLSQYIPSIAKRAICSNVCLYTLTPDGEFSLGPLPGYENVLSASLAGHGFKFAPVLGEVLADMLTETAPAFDVTMFSPNRFE